VVVYIPASHVSYRQPNRQHVQQESLSAVCNHKPLAQFMQISSKANSVICRVCTIWSYFCNLSCVNSLIATNPTNLTGRRRTNSHRQQPEGSICRSLNTGRGTAAACSAVVTCEGSSGGGAETRVDPIPSSYRMIQSNEQLWFDCWLRSGERANHGEEVASSKISFAQDFCWKERRLLPWNTRSHPPTMQAMSSIQWRRVCR
jgi:hypothetical protein